MKDLQIHDSILVHMHFHLGASEREPMYKFACKSEVAACILLAGSAGPL